MRGRCSLAIEQLQSDYGSCFGKAGGSLFRSGWSDWPASIFFARRGPLLSVSPRYRVHRVVFGWFYYLAPWASVSRYATVLECKPFVCRAPTIFPRIRSNCSYAYRLFAAIVVIVKLISVRKCENWTILFFPLKYSTPFSVSFFVNDCK